MLHATPQVSELTHQQAKSLLVARGKRPGRPTNYVLALRAQAGEPVTGNSSTQTWQALTAAAAAAAAAPAQQPRHAAPQQQRAQPVQRAGPGTAAAAAASPAGAGRPASRGSLFTPAAASPAAPAATADALARNLARLLPCIGRVVSPDANPADVSTIFQVLAEVQQQPPPGASVVGDAARQLGQWSPMVRAALGRAAGDPQPAAASPASAGPQAPQQRARPGAPRQPAAAAAAAAPRQPAVPAADGVPDLLSSIPASCIAPDHGHSNTSSCFVLPFALILPAGLHPV